MALFLRKFPQELHTALKVWAAKRGQTMQALIIQILESWCNIENRKEKEEGK